MIFTILDQSGTLAKTETTIQFKIKTEKHPRKFQTQALYFFIIFINKYSPITLRIYFI